MPCLPRTIRPLATPVHDRRVGDRPGAPGALALAATASAAVLALGGCGGGSSTATGTSPTGTGTSSPTAAAAYPVTITRTGGLAGFDDRLVLEQDGSVTGTTKAGPVSCRVRADVADALAHAAATAPTEGTGPTSDVADAIVITIVAGSHTAFLGGSAAGDPGSEAVTALLGDLTRPEAERTVCT